MLVVAEAEHHNHFQQDQVVLEEEVMVQLVEIQEAQVP
jgi:hypothetical protein